MRRDADRLGTLLGIRARSRPDKPAGPYRQCALLRRHVARRYWRHPSGQAVGWHVRLAVASGVKISSGTPAESTRDAQGMAERAFN